MQTVHFLGRVIAHGLNINLPFTPRIIISEPDLNFYAMVRVRITGLAIDVEFQIESFRHEQFNIFYLRAYDQAHVVVDLLSFESGIAQVVVFDEFVDPGGQRNQIQFADGTLRFLCTSFRINMPGDSSFDQVYRLVATDPEFFLTLRDLASVLTTPNSASINCGRVLDGIKRMISPTIADNTQAWSAMQTALNISRSYQKWITGMSASPRHADRSFVSETDTSEIIRRTWIIMDRFIEYRKRSNTPLTAPEFRTL